MASSTCVNPILLRIGSYQVHLRDYCYEVNVRHILLCHQPYWLPWFCFSLAIYNPKICDLLPTVEAFPLELLLLRDSPFWSQLTIIPFIVGFLELGTLTMFHKVSLGLARIVCPFLLRSPIVFFDAKSNNQNFDAHLLSLML